MARKSNTIAFSPHAACAILESYGLSADEIVAVLKRLIAEGKAASGYFRGDDLAAFATPPRE